MELKELAGIAHKKQTEAGMFAVPGRFSKQLGSLHEIITEALVEYAAWGSITDISHSMKTGSLGSPLGVPVAMAEILERILAICVEYHIDLEEAIREMDGWRQAQIGGGENE